MEDLIGAVLNNHYRIEQFVGSGGMAEVYKARDVDAPHDYAIKVIREQLLEQPSFVQRFRDEAQRLRDLQHPNIVRFYDFVTSDGLAYIVMDYIDGYPLSRLLRLRRQRGEGPLPVEESVRILAQIARALSRVHEQGLVHRDVKPGNILIRQSDGAAFLTDLGIAKDLATSAVTHTLIGTFAYLAPEQILRQPVSPATDIYALGTVAYQLFTNHRPFEGPTDDLPTAEMEQRLIEQHLRQLPRPPSTHNPRLSTELDTAVSRALAKPPDARYPDVMAFMRAVHDAVRPLLPADMQILSQVDARPVPTRFSARRGRREGGRPRGLLPAVLALALIGIVAAALLMLSGAIPSPFPRPTPSDTATPTATSTTPAPSDTATPTAPPTETPNLTTTAGWLTLEAERLALETTGTALALAVVPASATPTPTPSATPSLTPSRRRRPPARLRHPRGRPPARPRTFRRRTVTGPPPPAPTQPGPPWRARGRPRRPPHARPPRRGAQRRARPRAPRPLPRRLQRPAPRAPS
ncbi:MAG: serine/threonine protein kinase [Anaerolineae bacterium]|nr:serine/threonine protein kinase [Anaerolineae bacterium]